MACFPASMFSPWLKSKVIHMPISAVYPTDIGGLVASFKFVTSLAVMLRTGLVCAPRLYNGLLSPLRLQGRFGNQMASLWDVSSGLLEPIQTFWPLFLPLSSRPPPSG